MKRFLCGLICLTLLLSAVPALAVGVTFAFLNVNIFTSIALIGCTTCVLSMAGVKIGSVFGDRFEKKAEILGGVILILLGVRILLEHLEII